MASPAMPRSLGVARVQERDDVSVKKIDFGLILKYCDMSLAVVEYF